MKKHPEDSQDWSEFVNKRDDWAIPDAGDGRPEPITRHEPDQPPVDQPSADAVGPYGATESPWKDFDDRDANPPRESTPYDETNPFTNHAAWRYQQNPYRGDPQEHSTNFRSALLTGLGLGVALIVIALLLL
ncbi:hypothetical protein [Flaviflexus equikiangi]|uniref:hypothetical protein n=1 Tax=Flaviflexus equikiangi TaxID=2758573 RepID=UPI0015F770BF|nr:hypothetical protein [Flaviflexus equikiangi]